MIVGTAALLMLFAADGPATTTTNVAPDAPATTTAAPDATPASATAAPATAPAGPTLLRIAVTDVKSSDVSLFVGRVVTASITAELRKLDGLAVIAVDEVKDSLDHEAQKQLVGCADDHCLADIVGALGVDELVVGTVAHVGAESVFGLRRIRMDGSMTNHQVDQRLAPSDGEEFLAAVGPAVQAIFPDHGLKKGKVRGVADELALKLHPPPLPTTVFYVGAVGAGVAAAAGAATTAYWGYTVNEFNAHSSDGADIQARSQQELTARFLMIGMWSATGLVAAGTALSVPFTDWHHLQDGVAIDAQ
jgi:hypothetical protein